MLALILIIYILEAIQTLVYQGLSIHFYMLYFQMMVTYIYMMDLVGGKQFLIYMMVAVGGKRFLIYMMAAVGKKQQDKELKGEKNE